MRKLTLTIRLNEEECRCSRKLQLSFEAMNKTLLALMGVAKLFAEIRRSRLTFVRDVTESL